MNSPVIPPRTMRGNIRFGVTTNLMIAALVVIFCIGGIGQEQTRGQEKPAAKAKPIALKLEANFQPHRPFATPEKHPTLAGTAFSPGESLIATVGAEGLVKIWDAKKKKLRSTLVGHKTAVRSVAFSADGQALASGGADGTILLWEHPFKEKQKPQSFQPANGPAVFGLAFSPDGGMLAAAMDQTVRVWTIQTKMVMAQFTANSWPIPQLSFTPDGKSVAYVNGSQVTFGNVNTGKLDGHIAVSKRGFNAFAFSVDGTVIASGNQFRDQNESVLELGEKSVLKVAGTDVILSEFPTKKELARIRAPFGGVWSAAFSPDGRILAVGGIDGSLLLYDVNSRQLVGLVAQAHSSRARLAGFSSDGKLLVTAGDIDNLVKVWGLKRQ